MHAFSIRGVSVLSRVIPGYRVDIVFRRACDKICKKTNYTTLTVRFVNHVLSHAVLKALIIRDSIPFLNEL